MIISHASLFTFLRVHRCRLGAAIAFAQLILTRLPQRNSAHGNFVRDRISMNLIWVLRICFPIRSLRFSSFRTS